jgi:hypothetical protein
VVFSVGRSAGSHMNDKAKQRSTSFARWITLVVVVVCVYLFSMGPNYLFLRKGALAQKAFSSLYRPVLYLSDHSRPVYRAMEWYCSLWYSDEREIARHLREMKTEK